MEKDYLKIAEQVKNHKTAQNLMCYVNEESLIKQHKLQIKKKATGIDGIGKLEYGKNVEQNVENLIERMKKFSYKPLPVRRTHIPKMNDVKLRPLGIPAYEDKLVQGVMANILSVIYESRFKEFSYGFRPNKSAHNAVNKLTDTIITRQISSVVDVDIKGFFDNVNHEWLVKFLEHDIKDKNFIRYIKRFLKAGVMEQGKYLESDKGTPQGGSISPILANIYLHYVLDLWFEKEITNKFKGESRMIRYADDFVCCFKYQSEANKFYRMLKKRLQKFGLELAENKTNIIGFGRYARGTKGKGNFDFLGFTLINAKSKNGKYTVARHTSNAKLKAKKAAAKKWLRENMHLNKAELVKKLNIKLVGHYRYYGVTGNIRKLEEFAKYVEEQLFKTLNRRSQRKITWEKFHTFRKYNPLAKPKIYVSYLRSE